MVLFTVTNYNDFDEELSITQIYLDYSIKRFRPQGVSFPKINDTRTGRIDLGAYELAIGENKQYLDKFKIFIIPKNSSAHFKVRLFGKIEDCSECTIQFQKCDLIFEFIEPEKGETKKLIKPVQLYVY